MPDGGITELAVWAAEAWAAYGTYVEVALAVAAAYQSYESAERAKEAYNASLRDRYVMQRTAVGQRALVLGRARVSGPIAFMQSYGTNQSTLAMVIVLAAHECDAIEKVYFNDTPLIIDSNNNVVGTVATEHFSVNSSSPLTVFLAVPVADGTVTATVTYTDGDHALTTSLNSDKMHLTLTGARAGQVGDVKVTYQPRTCQYTPNQVADKIHTETAAATFNTFTFPAASSGYTATGPRGSPSAYANGLTSATSVVVVQTIGGKQTALPFTMTQDGNGHALTVSWSGATVGATVQVTYQSLDNASRARIRQYRGATGQVADATLITNLPGQWTSAHIGTGLCYLVCEFDYDQSSFSAGLPNVSAVLRGAKIFDPRTSTIVWTENPAVMVRGYWTHAVGANLSASLVDDAAIIAAANVCDPTANYFVGPTLLPRPGMLYTAGYVATKDMKPQDVLTDLCQAMGGRWVINGNVLRVKAGAYTSPVAAIDASWLTSESGVSVQPLPPRQSLFNSAQGSFADSTNDYRMVPYPKVSAAALITADGRELPLDLSYTAVTRTEQVQYLASCAIRYNRAGMTIRLACNMKAFALDVFDVVSLTLPRFGFVAQVFEVTDTAFTADGLLTIALKYIDPSIWALDASYSLTAYAPKTNLPAPWTVEVPTVGIPVTGPAQMLLQADGTAVSRIYASITVTDLSVITGGFIDVAYIDASDDTSSNWSSITLAGDAQGVYISGIRDGHTYLIKARARNTLFTSAWSASSSIQIVGQTAPPASVAGVAYQALHGALYFTWTPCADADYKETRVQYGPVGTTGNAWGGGGMVEPFHGLASQFNMDSPGAGVYEFQIRHYNWSGIATASSIISVTAPDTMSHIVSTAGTTATWTGVTGTGKPSDNATTDLVLIARGQCVVAGNTGTKPTGTAAWDSDIYSKDSYTGGAFASAVAVSTATAVMFGLNSDPLTDQSYTSLDYAWYLTAGGGLQIYESNVLALSGLTYAVGDVLVVLYDGVHVAYYQNGALARVVNATAGVKLFFDSSFNSVGASLANIRFGPQTSISAVTAAAAAAALTATWSGVSSTPTNLAALTGSEGIQNTLVNVNGSGQIAGIGTGSGTTVANSLLTAPIAAAAQTAIWTSVSSTPSNLTALTGSEVINNTGISVNGSGLITGIGTGAGTAVANSLLTATIADKISQSAGGVLSATVSLGAVAGAGFVAGTLTWNSSGVRTGGYGVAMTPGGLVGYNASGVATFSLDASTGAAYFGGTLAVGTASTGAVTGTALSGSSNGASVSSIGTGSITCLTRTIGGGDLLVSLSVETSVQTNTNTSVRIQIDPTVDGSVWAPGTVSGTTQMDSNNTHVAFNGGGATAYNWGLTCTHTLTFVIPAGSLTAGSHTFGFWASAFFYNTSGTATAITGSSILAKGTETLREFLA